MWSSFNRWAHFSAWVSFIRLTSSELHQIEGHICYMFQQLYCELTYIYIYCINIWNIVARLRGWIKFTWILVRNLYITKQLSNSVLIKYSQLRKWKMGTASFTENPTEHKNTLCKGKEWFSDVKPGGLKGWKSSNIWEQR